MQCGGISLKREKCYLHLKTPRISLICKLVPVPCREHEYGLMIEIANSRAIKHFFNFLFLFCILGSNNNQDNAGEGQARTGKKIIVLVIIPMSGFVIKTVYVLPNP